MDKNVLDYGAIGDGRMNCTSAIQAAVDACAASGGGRVTIPAGTYISGTIWLRSHVELHLAQAAVLKASTNLDDYNELDAYEQNSTSQREQWVGKHLILAVECEDVAISGNGTMDGSGDYFFAEPRFLHKFHWIYGQAFAKDQEKLRPGQLVCFIECQNVRVENVTLRNITCWGYFFHGCDVVNVHGIRVFNELYYSNTDGIDIDCCSRVTVSDCIIDTGDDGITLRGNNQKLKNKDKVCEFITITNCVLGSCCCGFRFGVGDGVIRHVQISNITMNHSGHAFFFLTDYRGNGHVCMEDIHINGVSAAGVAYPLEIMEGNNAYIRNVTIENYNVEAYACASIHAVHENMLSDITLRNVKIKLVDSPIPLTEADITGRGEHAFYASNVSKLTLENVSVVAESDLLPKWGSFLKTDSCSGLELRNVLLPNE